MKLLSNTRFILLMLLITVFQNCVFENKKTKENIGEIALKKFTDDQLLDTIQYQTFNYFWDGAEPNSGLARERLHMDDVYPTSPKNTVTTGGSGFGLMAILVAQVVSLLLP